MRELAELDSALKMRSKHGGTFTEESDDEFTEFQKYAMMKKRKR